MGKLILPLIFSLLATPALFAQTSSYDIETYKDFMSEHKDMPPSALYQLYPSDVFQATVPSFNLETVKFWDKMDSTYNFTGEEKTLLMNNGFMVTERLRPQYFGSSFFTQFIDVYYKDLPVFVSTDAILHAFHLSYDELLKLVEIYYLIPELKKLLDNAHFHLSSLDEKYGQIEEMKPMLRDVDVYLTVAQRLMNNQVDAFYPDNDTVVNEYLTAVNEEKMTSVFFFSDDTCREIDFSQFKPRGHYEFNEEWLWFWPFEIELPEYFQTMMWLGRLELYLDHPDYNKSKAIKATVNRQIVDAMLVNELFNAEENASVWEGMEDIISFFVGVQDNVSPVSMNQILQECGINLASELLEEKNINIFMENLRQNPFAGQQILSQVFEGNDNGTTRPLPSSYMPFGQRFVIDSYVTSQVVYDRIIHEGENMCRLVPSTLDVMFALGNNAATQLLIPELQEWHYSDNLAGLRFLIGQYGDEFWESSLYNLWLYAIQSLNPDPGTDGQPEFMKTAAWGLEKMNTQLASWAELRHDNLLYAKQSYTSNAACSHPKGYVEPNPEFFRRMKRLAEIAENKFLSISEKLSWDYHPSPASYFHNFYSICDTLQNIAGKELSNEELNDAECGFLDKISFLGPPCDPPPMGWYTKLIYNNVEIREANLVVADYHTTPTDCFGTPLGWVCHAGTGFADMAVVVAPLANGELCAFAGPVASYHEYRTSDFLRLTDTEWEEQYLTKSFRPDWVYNYLADNKGKSHETERNFYTNSDELLKALNNEATSVRNRELITSENISIAPNPISQTALITLKIPESYIGENARLSVYDLSGKLVRILINQPLPSGYFVAEWDCKNNSGNTVPDGAYFLLWEQGDTKQAVKLVVAR